MAPTNLSSTGSISDNGLGILAASATGTAMLLGVSSAGTAGTIYSFRGPDVSQVTSQLGYGPGVDAVIGHLLKSGGRTVHFLKVTPSTAGANSAVTRSNGSSPVITLTGTPNDDYQCVVEVLTTGTLGVATFRYSLDNGDTWSDSLLTAATYALPSGVTLNMPAGTYTDGDLYTFTSSAPAMTSGDIGTAMDTAIASPLKFEFFHILGSGVDAAAQATIAAVISTKVTAAHSAHKYCFAVFESPAVSSSSLITAFGSYTDKFVVGCAGYCELTRDRTDITGAQVLRRSSGRLIVPRLSRNPISIHPGRNTSDSDLDAVTGVVSLVPTGETSGGSNGYYDENATGTLNDARFATLRTFDGREGYYISNVPTFAAGTSDLQSVQALRVVLLAAQTFYAWSLTNLGKVLRTNGDGTIAASAADAIEDDGTQVVKAAVGPHSEGLAIIVNRADDVLSTGILRAQIRIKPFGYLQVFDWEVALARALPQAA